jgi:hypothetical protein
LGLFVKDPRKTPEKTPERHQKDPRKTPERPQKDPPEKSKQSHYKIDCLFLIQTISTSPHTEK